MRLVCNASPLIFLAKIDLIQLLPRLTEELTIPSGVYHEIKSKKDAAAKWLENYKDDYVIEVGPIPKLIGSWDLGKGETEVITHAYFKKDLKAALDDRAARNCAASVGVNVVGTIGLILLAKKKGHIENPTAYIKNLKKTGFRISDELFEHAIYLAGK